jgi:glycosyltransferase involved in cell wall biosynthesis
LKKPTIIFAVQLPPPIHGSSIINQLIVENESINKKFNTIILPIQMANGMADMGLFSIKKVFDAIKIFVKQFWLFATKKINIYYIALSPLGFAFYKDFFLIFLAKMFHIKIIIHLHGQGIKHASEKSFIKRKMYQLVFKNTEVICLAKSLFDDIKELYKGTPHFLSNGIEKETSLEYTKKEIDFLYFSNLMKEKGIEIFLQALLNIHNKGFDFKAEIVGDSADYTIAVAKEFINKMGLGKKVEVLGPIYGKEKYNYFIKARVFILPSLRECFPLTILEAFQAKTAVIATNTGGVPEIVQNNINGFIIEPNDLTALVEKMELFLKDKNIDKTMGELNFAKFEENYTQEIFIKRLTKILESNFI